MNWPKAYLDSIRSGETAACAKIKAVYEREVAWIENPPEDFPFYFDEEAGEHVIGFIEKFCKHYEGRWGGRPIELELFQKAKLQLVFGWKEKTTKLRRFREVVDVRARKCGKSTETAAVEQNVLLNDGESGAKIFCTANKKEQADIIFEAAVNMRAQSPALLAITKKRQNDIYFPDTFSYIKSIAADTKTMDGLNAHFFSQDEFHEAHDRRMYDVMKQSQSAREQPLAWLISTNGFVREGFFDQVYDYCAHVAMWEEGFQDYRTLPLIYELDSREEWTDEACWEKANPGLGKIKSVQFLRDNVERAKRDPSFLPTVLTKDFNIPENTSEAWLPYGAIVNETTIDEAYVTDTYAIGGCDLSSTTDLTCATLLICKPNDENFYVLQHYFLPQSRVNDTEISSKREAPYRLWAEKGWITICEGATVDFHAVTEWFADMRDRLKISPLWIGYDRALSGYWREEMDSAGFDMDKIAQGPYTFSYPMKELGGLLEDHKIVYGNNPILRWCLLNTGVKTLNKDGINTIQPVKTGKTKRIDGMVSLLNAFVCYKNHEAEYLSFVR